MVYIYFIFYKNTGSGVNINEALAKELHSKFKDLIWEANFCVKYLLCVINVFSKYAWVTSLTDKKAKTVFDDFIEIVNESKCKIK